MGSTCAPLIAHAYLGQYSRYYADDFCFQVQLKSKGIIGAALFYYNEITGRFSNLLFENFTALFNTNVLYGSYTFIFIWFTLLTYVIHIFLKQEKQNLISCMLISSAILFATFDLIPNMHYRRVIDALSHTWDPYPGIFQSLYWIAGRNRMVTPLILGTILTGLICVYSYKDYRGKQKALVIFISAFTSFIAGGFGETYVVLQTTILALLFFLISVWAEPRLKQKLILPVGIILSFSILSMIIIIVAPGVKIELSISRSHQVSRNYF